MTDEQETATMAEIAKRLEAEGLAAEPGFAPGGPSPGMSEIAAEARERDGIPGRTLEPGEGIRAWFPSCDGPSALPLSDLRDRLAMLKEAGVLRYRDAGVEIQFDPESKRSPEPPLDGRSVERF